MYTHDYRGSYGVHTPRVNIISLMYTYGPQYLRNQCNTTVGAQIIIRYTLVDTHDMGMNNIGKHKPSRTRGYYNILYLAACFACTRLEYASCAPLQCSYQYYCFTDDVIKIIRNFNKKTRGTRPQYKNINVHINICVRSVYLQSIHTHTLIYIHQQATGYIYVYIYIYWIQNEGSNLLLVSRYSDAFYFSFLNVIGFFR